MNRILTLFIFILGSMLIAMPVRVYESDGDYGKKNADFLNARIAKWYDNHTAAISITHDEGNITSEINKRTNQFVIQSGVTIDYEVITHSYMHSPYNREYLLKELIPAGIGYFGHGHKHIEHDQLSYDEALQSFKRCYDEMKRFGLKPVAYAYPKGAAWKKNTRNALEAAGFLSGRLYYSPQMLNPYIVPGSQLEPSDWFGLPTLVMEDYAFSHCEPCINNNEQLLPHLDRALLKNAWVILTYHAIGEENGYGYFNFEEFKKNIHAIKNRDFWIASMNAVTLYIREHAHAEVKIVPMRDLKNDIREIGVTISDGLPNDTYDQPLTLLFNLPESWVNQSIALVENGKTVKTVSFPSNKGAISIRPDEVQRKLMIEKE